MNTNASGESPEEHGGMYINPVSLKASLHEALKNA